MDVTVPLEVIRGKIYLVRGQKILIDSDLAEMYGVETKNLNKAVKRNISRFPQDFMFQLTIEESASLKFQIGTSSQSGHGGRRYNPYVFTEQGVAMLSSVLNSDRAVQVNIAIMRAFVQMRELAVSNIDISKRLDELEQKYDSQFRVVFDAIREMMEPLAKRARKIGFTKQE
jgi:phage regulator Rha-like protein